MGKKATYVIEAYKPNLLKDIESIDNQIHSYGIEKEKYWVTLNPRNTRINSKTGEEVYALSVYVIQKSLGAAAPIANELERVLQGLEYETVRKETYLLWDEDIVAIDISSGGTA